ncbi:hypothetical protein BACCIP111883_04135 [Sutcliffiella rhizosphaerae]|uniref:DUF2268 domain-containing protein n=1 Tax=Sutcliffiella rhizosphaerae TaxID=2880967 RepID=A0ABN8ADM5_9BACI|nr:hypothetical protein BACCIP111883_04135 [Sutcliffiella rhizosphaerae]
MPKSKELNQWNLEHDPHFSVPNDIQGLQNSILELDSQHEKITKAIQEGLEDATNLLNRGDYNIYILPFYSGYSSEDLQGVAGFAVSSGSIVLQIDPQIYTEKEIKYTIIHEYHHAVYMEDPEYKLRSQHLLDRIVMEGKADILTKIAYPEYEVPWIEPLSETENDVVWNFIYEHKYSYKEEHLQKMHLGNSYEGIPSWSNYRGGFKIMQNFIEKNPEITIEEWTYYSAKDIVERTDFASILN